MHTTPSFDVQKMAEDMVVKGWSKLELAKRAQLSDMSVIRFLRGEQQTAKTAKKLAKALGQSVRRYLRTDASSESTEQPGGDERGSAARV